MRLRAPGDHEGAEPAAQADLLPQPVGAVVERQQGVEPARRHLAVGDVRLAALADGREAGAPRSRGAAPRQQRPLVGAHPRGRVERAPRVAEQEHGRVEEVGIEGERPAAGPRARAALRRGRAAAVADVVEDAAERHHVEAPGAEGEAQGVGLHPRRLAEAAARQPQGAERQVDPHVAAGRARGRCAATGRCRSRRPGYAARCRPAPRRRSAGRASPSRGR